MNERMRICGDGDRYIGKRLLVGITYESHGGEVVRREQFHGRIVEANDREIVIEREDNGTRVSLPPELQQAPTGEYRLRTTGEVVIDPDYLAQWTRRQDVQPERVQ